MTHPNIDIMNNFFDAYMERDMSALKLVMDENIKWTFPGRNYLSGTKTGIDEVIDFFDVTGRILGESSYKIEKLVIGADHDYVIECHHVWPIEKEQYPDYYWCILWKFKDGKIIEGRALSSDQYAVDEFFEKL